MDYKPAEAPLYKLMLGGRKLLVPKGQVVSTYDERPLFNLIQEGYVKRYMITTDGDKGIQVIFGPNEVFPMTPIYKSVFRMDIYRGPETYYYEAMTKLTMYSISIDTLLEALASNPLIYKDLYYESGVRLNSYIQRLETVSLRAARRKVAYQLIYLTNKFGRQVPEGVKLLMPLTHQDLADILGIARETVTRHITDLADKKIIASGKEWIVFDLDKLKAEAYD